MTRRETGTAMLVLAAAARVVEQIQDGVEQRGFADVRPTHGFALARVAAGGATAVDVAAHLGISKQAASQLVQQLLERGYLARSEDPDDARRWVLALTAHGVACTRAAEDAAAAAVRSWRPALGASGIAQLGELLGALDLSGPVRPAW